MPALSVVILTKNEEMFIGRCIRSVPFADEVVVLDSGSTDRTREVARAEGATFYQCEWPENWAVQRNRGINLAKHDWVLYLDADEIVTPMLARSVEKTLCSGPNPRDGYYPVRRGETLGQLLPNVKRHSRLKGLVRLFNRRFNEFDESMDVHEECHPVGRALPLEGDLLHWRGQTMHERISHTNHYARIESNAFADTSAQVGPVRLLGKPVLRFLWAYVAKRFFQSGTPGLIAALRMAFHEFITAAKIWERQNVPEPVRHPPTHIYRDEALRDGTSSEGPSASTSKG